MCSRVCTGLRCVRAERGFLISLYHSVMWLLKRNSSVIIVEINEVLFIGNDLIEYMRNGSEGGLAVLLLPKR